LRAASAEGIDGEVRGSRVVDDNYGAFKLSLTIDLEGILLAVGTLLSAYTCEAGIDGCVRVLGKSCRADERCEKEDKDGLEELHFWLDR